MLAHCTARRTERFVCLRIARPGARNGVYACALHGQARGAVCMLAAVGYVFSEKIKNDPVEAGAVALGLNESNVESYERLLEPVYPTGLFCPFELLFVVFE